MMLIIKKIKILAMNLILNENKINGLEDDKNKSLSDKEEYENNKSKENLLDTYNEGDRISIVHNKIKTNFNKLSSLLGLLASSINSF